MVPLSTANVTENNHNGASFIKKLFPAFIYIPLNRLYESGVFFSLVNVLWNEKLHTEKQYFVCVMSQNYKGSLSNLWDTELLQIYQLFLLM